jgi:uncharacterized protein YecE (DUF72 family)
MAVRIGISGWRYTPWRGKFYPGDLVQRRELHYASRCFGSIELNGSFYSLQTPTSYQRWHDDTPAGFRFAVKGPRYVTHTLRLRELGNALPNFFASGLLNLRGKLGPLLWQLPPTLKFDAKLLDGFLGQLPKDSEAACALARRRSRELMSGRSALSCDRNRRWRHALEIRHASFWNDEFVDLLRRHNIGLVIADAARDWPQPQDITADFVYMRLHGHEHLYSSCYTDALLERWAERIRAWSNGGEPADANRIAGPAPRRKRRDVYCYFDNDAKVHAPFDAQELMRMLELPTPCRSRRHPPDITDAEAGTGRWPQPRKARGSSP